MQNFCTVFVHFFFFFFLLTLHKRATGSNRLCPEMLLCQKCRVLSPLGNSSSRMTNGHGSRSCCNWEKEIKHGVSPQRRGEYFSSAGKTASTLIQPQNHATRTRHPNFHCLKLNVVTFVLGMEWPGRIRTMYITKQITVCSRKPSALQRRCCSPRAQLPWTAH